MKTINEMSRLALNSFSRLLSLGTSFGTKRLGGQPRYFSESSKHKPPPSAFLLFYHSKLQEIKEVHKDSPNKVTYWSKTASSMWKQLDEDAKKYYHDIFNQRQREYLSNITEEEILNRKKLMSEKRVKNVKRRLKQEARNLNKPKKAPTAHALYIMEQMSQSEISDMKSDMKHVFTKLGNEWKDLPDSEKERLFRDAQERKERHERELRAWEDVQIAGNRQYLARITRLKELELLPKAKSVKAAKSVSKSQDKKSEPKSQKTTAKKD